ncbi:MAG: cobalt ECF transporter T component CbiQ [Rhodobacteraceae bacterium]|nr:MAG: cobalt ECF transporter T component CbiQ [Paracoccaceae bacterium]
MAETSARARLILALVLAFGFASVQGLAVLPLVMALSLGVVLAFGAVRVVLRRMRAPLVLVLALTVVLPLISGSTVLAQIGPVALQLEGLQAAALIAGRLLSIVAVTLALLATLSPFDLVAGLRALRVPALMTDLALLTLRYLDEVTAELRRAALARSLRGGMRGWRALPEHARGLATSLIRAQTRSERLWAAMRLRGYGLGAEAETPPLQKFERLAITGAVIVALGVIWLDRIL